jgi:SAM-dependent methyltransferase
MARRPSNRKRNVWAVGLLEVGPGDRVLEIGFGPGLAIRELSRLATRGCVCGIDHSAEMVRQARRRNARAVRAGVLNTTPQLGSVPGSAVVGAVLQVLLAASLREEALAHAGGLPPHVQQSFIDGFTQAAHSGFQVGTGQTGAQLPSGLPPHVAAQIQQLAHDVFVNGYLTALRRTVLVAVAVVFVAALACLFVAGRVSLGSEASQRRSLQHAADS